MNLYEFQAEMKSLETQFLIQEMRRKEEELHRLDEWKKSKKQQED